MNARDIVLKVAETLPANASVLDAINDLELLAALNEASMEALDATNVPARRGPSWLYESPARLNTVQRQTSHSLEAFE